MSRSCWYVPPACGGRFNGVVSTLGNRDGFSDAWIVGSNEPCHVAYSLPVGVCCTLFQFDVLRENPWLLQPTEDAKVLIHEPADADSCSKVAEVCAGLGGIGIGAARVDFISQAFMDKNELCCSFLRRFGHTNVHCSDLCSDEDICCFLESLSQPTHVLAAGFSCQPFSFQGDQAGMQDPRATCQFFLGNLAHLLPGAVQDLGARMYHWCCSQSCSPACAP